MAKKYQERIRERKVIIEWHEKTYEGSRTVEGTNRLFQTVYYGGRSKFDSQRYSPSQETLMEVIAKVILRELVEEIESTKN